MFDTHSHLNFKDFKETGHDIARQCLDREMNLMVVGSQYTTSERAVKFASEYDKYIYAAIGQHPVFSSSVKVEDGDGKVLWSSREEKYEKPKFVDLIEEDRSSGKEKIKAIGEIGLEYSAFSDFEEEKRRIVLKRQKAMFVEQLELAFEFDLPVIIHLRDVRDSDQVYVDMAEILNEYYKELSKKGGVVHCYTSNWQNAKRFLDLGLYLGFTGIITFDEGKKVSGGQRRRIEEVHEVIKKMPKDKILSETDCPYLLPEPLKTQDHHQKNTPLGVEYVVRKIARLRGVSFEEADKFTVENGKRLFGI